MTNHSALSRRWAIVALAVVPILTLAACSTPPDDPFPAASPAVSSACQILDKYFLNQSAPQSELNKVLKDAENSGDTRLESDARAYQSAAAASNQSEKNEAFALMVGRCEAYGIGPHETP